MTEAQRAEIEARLQARLDREMMLAMTGTATVAPPAPTLSLATMAAKIKEWDALIRESRRNNVTIVVVDGHAGPMLHTQHPTDGRFIECSYAQAREIDRFTPLRLSKIEAVDRAHFEVAGPFGGFCPLIPPPYEMPDAVKSAADAPPPRSVPSRNGDTPAAQAGAE